MRPQHAASPLTVSLRTRPCAATTPTEAVALACPQAGKGQGATISLEQQRSEPSSCSPQKSGIRNLERARAGLVLSDRSRLLAPPCRTPPDAAKEIRSACRADEGPAHGPPHQQRRTAEQVGGGNNFVKERSYTVTAAMLMVCTLSSNASVSSTPQRDRGRRAEGEKARTWPRQSESVVMTSTSLRRRHRACSATCRGGVGERSSLRCCHSPRP